MAISHDPSFQAVCEQAGAQAEETETNRRLSIELAHALAECGMFSMFVPAAIGGGEMAPPAALARLQELARHDAASAWVCMIGATAALGAAYIAPEISKQIFVGASRITCGIFSPNGRAVRDGDDLIVSGRWAWASGSANADYIGLGCMLFNHGDDTPDPARMRLVMVPREAIIFHDTWHTMGLCGTSSGDVELRAARIPLAHSYSIIQDTPWATAPLYTMPYFGLLAAGVGGVALGNARAALDDFLSLAGAKRGQGESRTLAEKSRVQGALAMAEADWRAAHALFTQTLGVLWRDVEAGAKMNPEKKADLRLVATYAVRQSAAVVRAAHDLAGGTSVYRASPIQRRLRDAETMTQHMIANAGTYELVGRVMLGGYQPSMQL